MNVLAVANPDIVAGLLLLGLGYLVGYIVGRLDLIWREFSTFQKQHKTRQPAVKTEKPRDFFTKAADTDVEDQARAQIEINERKYVSAIKTDDLVKNEKTTLGKTTATDDDIGASVSKLAQLKGK
jgi:hypothetical protein